MFWTAQEKPLKNVFWFYSNSAPSGLKMNLDKTKCIWFGCVRPPENIVLHKVNIEWNPVKFTMLGVQFRTDLKEITKISLKKKIKSLQRELYQWTKRNLTPIGKITVIPSLMLAKIVHILIALPDPDMPEIKKLETLFYKFLWNKKPDKIKREIIVQNLEDGGLNNIVDKKIAPKQCHVEIDTHTRFGSF